LITVSAETPEDPTPPVTQEPDFNDVSNCYYRCGGKVAKAEICNTEAMFHQ